MTTLYKREPDGCLYEWRIYLDGDFVTEIRKSTEHGDNVKHYPVPGSNFYDDMYYANALAYKEERIKYMKEKMGYTANIDLAMAQEPNNEPA
jgi:hypothetical protein